MSGAVDSHRENTLPEYRELQISSPTEASCNMGRRGVGFSPTEACPVCGAGTLLLEAHPRRGPDRMQ